MKNSAQPASKHFTKSNEEPPELANVIDGLMRDAMNSKSMGIDELCQRYPKWSDELREVYPAVMALAAFDRSVSKEQAVPDVHSNQLDGTLGDFRILREIGRGGMGIVYEADQISLQRRVALKVLPFAALLDQRRLARFQNEARSAAMLKHSNIVSVYSVGCERGIHFYAMELIEGLSLAEVVADKLNATETSRKDSNDPARETVPVAAMSTNSGLVDRRAFFQSVARLGKQAAEALHYAHREGVTHRDIKPSNLMVDQHGQLFVTDFGLALVESDDRVTITGDLVGTLRYMSPEQIEDRFVDRQTDIYSLGLTLYEMCASRPAFDGANRKELIRKIVEDEPTRLSRINRSMPRDLETIITKSISKDASQRYSSAQQLADDLERFLNDRPVQARKPSTIEITRRWTTRNPVIATLLTAIGVLLASFSVGSTVMALRLAEASREKSRTVQQLEKASLEKEQVIYAHEMQLAKQAVDNADFMTAEQILKKWVRPGDESDPRGFEWYYLWKQSHPAFIEKTISHRIPTYSVSFLGNGDRLAVGWYGWKANIWDISSYGQAKYVRGLPTNGMVNYAIATIPDERVLLMGNLSGIINEWNFDTGTLLNRIELDPEFKNQPVKSISVSPSGDLLAIATRDENDHQVLVWNRRTNRFENKLSGLEGMGRTAFLKDGKLVVGSHKGDQLTLNDAQSLTVLDEIELQADGIRDMAVSPDFQWLATASYEQLGRQLNSRIDIWDTDQLLRISSLVLDHSYARAVTFSADGNRLAAGTNSGWVYIIDRDTASVLAKKKLHIGNVFGLAFSPDGSRLASAASDNRVHICNVDQLISPESTPIRFSDLPILADAYFVTNDLALACDIQGNAYFWETRSGKVEFEVRLNEPGTDQVHAAISPDKKTACFAMGHWPPKDGRKGVVKIVDIQLQSEVGSLDLPDGISYSVPTISKDNLLAVGGMKGIVVIDLRSQSVLKTLPGTKWAKGMSFSPNGTLLACGTEDGDIVVYDVPSFEKRAPTITTTNDACTHVSFSPDSQLIAICDLSNHITLYDVTNGQLVRQFRRLPSYASMTEFSSDGRRLVSADNAGKVRVWDVESGGELINFDVIPRYPVCGFSPDGNSIITTGGLRVKIFEAADPTELRKLTVAELDEVACRVRTGP